MSGFLIDSECLETLLKLGLTPLQAKTYLALTKIGNANVTTLSKTTNIAREEIYRTLPRLEKIGLAEKIIGRPTFYKPVPLKEGLFVLIQRRKNENAELQKKTREILQNLQRDSCTNTIQAESWQFIITSEQKLFRKRFDTFIQNAECKMDVITSPQVLEEMVFNHLTSLKKSLAKGIKIRVITEKTEDATLRNIQVLNKNRFFKLKYLYSSVPVTMMIVDDKEANVRISNDIVPSLWSNNPEFVKLTAYYFNDLWNQAKLK